MWVKIIIYGFQGKITQDWHMAVRLCSQERHTKHCRWLLLVRKWRLVLLALMASRVHIVISHRICSHISAVSAVIIVWFFQRSLITGVENGKWERVRSAFLMNMDRVKCFDNLIFGSISFVLYFGYKILDPPMICRLPSRWKLSLLRCNLPRSSPFCGLHHWAHLWHNRGNVRCAYS